MKKLFYFLAFAVVISVTSAFLASCGDDDGVYPAPQKSNVSFLIDNLSSDFMTLYDVKVTYKDLLGNIHEEPIDGSNWSYKELDGPADANIFCRAEAKLKSEYQLPDKDVYELTWHYNVSYYKPSTTAKSENPSVQVKKIAKDTLDRYINNNLSKTIVLLNLNL